MQSAEHFWAFSCAHYDQESVKKACLILQDQYQFNVNVLLLCCYLQKQNLTLDLPQIEHCLMAIADTHCQLDKVRAIRKEIKGSNDQAYQYLLRAELALEQQQQRVLIDNVNNQRLLPIKNKENIRIYAQHLKLEKCGEVLSLLNLLES